MGQVDFSNAHENFMARKNTEHGLKDCTRGFIEEDKLDGEM